jgi:hypothetical protein
VKAATTEILASYVYVFREARKHAGDRTRPSRRSEPFSWSRRSDSVAPGRRYLRR